MRLEDVAEFEWSSEELKGDFQSHGGAESIVSSSIEGIPSKTYRGSFYRYLDYYGLCLKLRERLFSKTNPPYSAEFIKNETNSHILAGHARFIILGGNDKKSEKESFEDDINGKLWSLKKSLISGFHILCFQLIDDRGYKYHFIHPDDYLEGNYKGDLLFAIVRDLPISSTSSSSREKPSKPRGRPKGSGSFDAEDAPLVARGVQMVMSREVRSALAAAKELFPEISGDGTDESLTKRLQRKISKRLDGIEKE